MKTLVLCILITHLYTNAFAQNIPGSWSGALQGINLKIVFNFSDSTGVLKGTMDSPDQGAYDIPLDEVSIIDDSIFLRKEAMGMTYKGKITQDNIVGVFNQGGMSIDLELTKLIGKKDVLSRPQTPKEPYPYYTEDIEFLNSRDSILLKGTISLPEKEGSYPMVIMISGSGPQDRNSEVLGHKLFLVVSDYLTKQGIGVLRYDDRGVGQSEGTQSNSTSEDYSFDTEAAVQFLKDQKYCSKIGLYGHSEGGLIAPMVATRNKNVEFLILVAAPGVRGDQILKKQVELTSLSEGMPEDILRTNQKAFDVLYTSIIQNKPIDSKENRDKLNEILGESMDSKQKKELISGTIDSYSSKWVQFFIRTNPQDYLSQISIPTLAINGDKDLQVYYKQNLKGIQNSIPKKHLKTVILKNHNHLMQESETGKVSEYGQIEQTTSPQFMIEVASWVNSL